MTTGELRAVAGRLRLIVGGHRPTPLVRSARHVEELAHVSLCLACGGVLTPLLQFTGSMRCQDCRDDDAPLRADLVEPSKPQTQAA